MGRQQREAYDICTQQFWVTLSQFTCIDITINQSDHLPGGFKGGFFIEEKCNLCRKYV